MGSWSTHICLPSSRITCGTLPNTDLYVISTFNELSEVWLKGLKKEAVLRLTTNHMAWHLGPGGEDEAESAACVPTFHPKGGEVWGLVRQDKLSPVEWGLLYSSFFYFYFIIILYEHSFF